MVFLRTGKTLDNKSLIPLSNKLRQLATLEFVNLYYENLNRTDPDYLFGDEIEYLIVHVDNINEKVQVFPIYPHIAKFLDEKRHLVKDSNSEYSNIDVNEDIELEKSIFTPEAASYMVESIPDEPYRLESDYVGEVRRSIYNRRKRLERILLMLGYENSRITTLTNFCRFGCDDFIYYGDEKFREIFLQNLDPKYHNNFYICRSPYDRFYQIANFFNSIYSNYNIYIKKYKATKILDNDKTVYEDDSRVSDDDKTVCEESTLNTDYLDRRDKFLYKTNNFELFPLLSKQQQDLANYFLNVSNNHTKTFDNDLYNHIVEQVFLYDPLLQDNTNHNNSYNHNTYNNQSDTPLNNFNENDYIIHSFAGGSCSLQLTFSCYDLGEARYLYDQFLVLTPIFLSLSSATVGFGSYLVDTDARHSSCSSLYRFCDKNGRMDDSLRIRFKSRNLFISNSDFCMKNYRYLNDIKVASDLDSFLHLTKLGVDPILARYVSHILKLDPIVVYEEDFNKVNCRITKEHFESFHYTNWTSVRLNHPIFGNNKESSNNTVNSKNKLPWRVEFRPMEIQLTDEGNVMFISVVSYLAKVMLKRRLNLYMPISLVDLNTEVSSKIESCHREMFYFRECVTNDKLVVKKFSLYDILFGKVGLFTIVLEHLEDDYNSKRISQKSYEDFKRYFNHFEQLTLGKHPTNATQLRRFIQTHPDYAGDGVISEKILYDIVKNLTCF